MGTTSQDVEYWKMEEDVEEEASSLKCRNTKEEVSPVVGVPAASEIHDDDQLVLLQPETHVEAEGKGKGNGVLSQAQQLQSERSIYFDSNDGTEVGNGTGEVKSSVVGHSVSGKKLANGESHFSTNGVDNLKSAATETSNGISGVKDGVISNSVTEKKLGNEESDFIPNGVDITKSVVIETNNQKHEIPKVDDQSDLHLSHSIKSSENGVATFKPDDKPNLEVVEESIQEVAEWDVERVIEEQETHDLFCPNCHSCITKRVILRKRKRIQNIQNDTKPQKIKVGQPSSLGTNNEARDTDIHGLDGSAPSGDTTDRDRVEDPEVFRCLSCFSFFIPSVASFKSFWTFGNKGEDASVQNYQEVHARMTVLGQGKHEAQHVEEVGIGELKSQYPANQSNEVSLATAVPNKSSIQPANNVASEGHGNVNDYVVTSTTSVMRNAASEGHSNGKDYTVTSTTSVMYEVVKTGGKETAHGAVIQNERDDEINTFSTLPTTYPWPVDSHATEEATFPSKKLSTDDQNGQVSSSSISVHHVETRVDTSKGINRGDSAMHDQHAGNSLNLLAHMEENLHHGNNGFILNHQGVPGSFNTKLEELGKDMQAMSLQEPLFCQDKQMGFGKYQEELPMSTNSGKDVILQISSEVSQSLQSTGNVPMPNTMTSGETEHGASGQIHEATISNKWDILKSIVYGGLVESITSLAVISSAAGGDATTLNIVALGLANLLGGLFIIVHNLVDLKNEPYGGDIDPNTTVGRYQELDRYEELLGKRRNFTLHAVFAVLSYIIFGLIAPVTYGFSFRKSDNKEYKLIVVAVAALACIILLATAKTYVRKPPKAYIKTVFRYVIIGVMSSGLSYVAGTLIRKLLQNLGVFDSAVVDPVSPPSAFLESMAAGSSWASY